jgi:uncharacterized membrane protein HdeD (DUF308 family)
MDITVVLARFWGTLLVTAGVALLINKKLLPDIVKERDDKEYLLLSGFISLLIGAFQVSFYNHLEISVRGLITFFGWVALIKGFIRLGAPQISKEAIGKVGTNKSIYYPLLGSLLVIGVYLLYYGFAV